MMSVDVLFFGRMVVDLPSEEKAWKIELKTSLKDKKRDGLYDLIADLSRSQTVIP